MGKRLRCRVVGTMTVPFAGEMSFGQEMDFTEVELAHPDIRRLMESGALRTVRDFVESGVLPARLVPSSRVLARGERPVKKNLVPASPARQARPNASASRNSDVGGEIVKEIRNLTAAMSGKGTGEKVFSEILSELRQMNTRLDGIPRMVGTVAVRNVQAGGTVEGDPMSFEDPVYIPSDVSDGVKVGSLKIEETVSDDDVSESARKLARARRGGGSPKVSQKDEKKTTTRGRAKEKK